MEDLFVRFGWQRAVISAVGPPKSATRHLLLTLALHMNADGSSCYPSLNLLAAETQLDRATVKRHLAIAENAGWIRRQRKQRSDGTWGATVYEPMFPEGIGAQCAHIGAGSARDRRRGRPGIGAEDARDRRRVRPESISETTNETTKGAPAPSAPGAPRGKWSRSRGTESAPSWSARACELWTARFGGTAPGGRIGKALKPLIAQHGEAEVLAVWERYLATQPAEFANPQDFGAKYGTWMTPAPQHPNGRRTEPARYAGPTDWLAPDHAEPGDYDHLG